MRWLWLLLAVASCDWVFRLDPVPDQPRPDAFIPLERPWAQVTAGHSHTCAITTSGTLYCWGANTRGQTGTGRVSFRVDSPTEVAPGTTWLTVSTRENTTCGIKTDRSLWCWGNNDDGQVGNNEVAVNNEPKREPVKIGVDSWDAVQTSIVHTCAIRSDKALFCWGLNDAGQLGDSTTMRRLTPTQVAPTQPTNQWKELSLGAETTCALSSDDALWCWGNNNDGEFGLSAPASATTPTLANPLDKWSHIALGDNHGCGILAAGTLRCWGHNGSGQLGDGTRSSRKSAALVSAPAGARTDWVQIAATHAGVCARSQEGVVDCWGESPRFQLGVGDDFVPTPVALGDDRRWSQIAMGVTHTCMIASDESLWCIGNDGAHQLGDGGTSATTPIQVPGEWQAVATGLHHTCAVNSAGAVLCAGLNNGSQLGLGHGYTRAAMTENGLTGFATIMAGYDHSCATVSNTMKCWGSNYAGQLGTGDRNNLTTPQFAGPFDVADGARHSCAINSSTAKLSCWGENDTGQVGNGTTSLTPVVTKYEHPTGQWSLVDVGRHHSCAVDTAGALSCWGANSSGELGTGNNTPLLSPTSTGLGGVTLVAAGGYHTCTLQGAVARCWGAGYYGQLGLGSAGARSSPVMLADPYRHLSGGEEYTCGVRTNGTLWCWGYNAFGMLGDGTLDNRLSPVQVGTQTDWSLVSASNDHTCGIRAGNQLYCWGDNNDGQLGTGTASRTALVQVP